MKRIFRSSLCLLIVLMTGITTTKGAIRTSIASGNWNASGTWSPSGVPQSSDTVIIANGHTITVDANKTILGLTISSGGTLQWTSNNVKALTVNGAINVSGTLNMSGDLIFSNARTVTVHAGGTLIWNPNTNTAAGSTLFTNGIENYDPNSLLVIKKWYDYVNVPLATVVSSDFGNLTMNSVSGNNSISEWNQNNGFQTRRILGTLTIDMGWITLDKSGSMTNTILNNVVLNSANSYLYAHNGTHPNSCTLTLNNLTNTGGTFWGLVNGNGNFNLIANGNITNSGNFKLINNSGVANVSNGNAGITVGSTFSQSAGDARFIYNVSTLNSGVYTATINNLTVTGGVFMGHTGVNVNGGTCTLNILNNLTIAFTASSDIFRGISMSSISGTMNTAKLTMFVGGNVNISGLNASEYTSSASSGDETITVSNNYTTTGATSSYNYGAATAGHAVNLNIGGNISHSGGTTHWSRLTGNASISMNGSLNQSSGTMAFKSSTGSCTANLSGNFNMTGGNCYLHFNSSEVTYEPVELTVNGNFSQSAGTINFDDNTSNLSAQHALNIAGGDFNISGGGVMTHGGAGSCTSFGILTFKGAGQLNYNRSSTHFLTQVKQRIASGCTLNVVTGPIQVASHQSTGFDYFRISSNGRLQLLNSQVFSNSQYSNSGIQVDSNGTFATARMNGFYDGTLNGAVNSNGNMDFFLHGGSIVEYYGFGNQILTGTGTGIATANHHRYGILEVNLNGVPGTYVNPVNDNVFIRTQLRLEQGEINLSSFAINILNGQPSGIIRNNGYVKSEMNVMNNTSMIIWHDFQPGTHIFPFGKNASTYIPVSFKAHGNYGTPVSISTRSTQSTDNLPFPPNTTLNGVSSPVPTPPYCPHAITEVVDRWWHINVTGNMDADITLSYEAGAENTLTANQSGPMGISAWAANGWTYPLGIGTGMTNGIGTVSAFGVSDFNHLIVTANNVTLPVQLLDFQAKGINGKVMLDWATSTEINNDYFTVERSSDGIEFFAVCEVDGAGNSSHVTRYTAEDPSPLSGTSYYRLRQTDYDGKYSYSDTRVVGVRNGSIRPVTVEEIGPNPFDDRFHLQISRSMPGPTHFQLYDLKGGLVYERKEVSEAGNSIIEFNDLPLLASGSYMLYVSAEGQTEIKKMIKK